MIVETTRRVAAVSVVIILIMSMMQIMHFKTFIDTVSAGSSWTQTTYSDFIAGTLDNVTVTPEGNVTLALQTEYIRDDFTDESKIGYKENVIVDTALGEVRPVKGINRTFGGSDLDWGWWVQQTSDYGYVLFGETVSFGAGGFDAWLVKTDEHGNEEWNRTYGGYAKDGARSGQQTGDGGYLIGGYADSYGFPGHDGWLIKTDNAGNEQWNYTFGGPGTDAFFSSAQASDGGFVGSGYETSFGSGGYDVWLVKTNSLGIEQWNRSYGGGGSEHGMSVKQASDNGFIIAGYTSSYGAGGTDLWLIKTDGFGNEQWNYTFGGSDDDWGGSVFQTSDGGYIVSGDTRSYGSGGFDVWLIKTDGSGNEEWNVTYGEPNSDDTGYCIHQALDGGYIVAVSSTSYITGFTDIWLIKTDGNGIEEWRKTFGGSNDDWGYSVDQTADEGFVITGYTTSYGAGNLDVWLIKTDAYGNYNYEGELISVNLLSGKSAFSIDMFNCTASIPMKNRVHVQFSQDNSSWYNSLGALGGKDILINGFNSIDISLLKWNGSNFYYRLNLSSSPDGVPAVQNINISYRRYVSSGEFISQSFDCGGANVEWKTLNWIATEPIGTEVKFQLRSADIQSNLSAMNFVGPDGGLSTYYTVSGSDIWTGHDGHPWVQFKANLFGMGNITPKLQEVTIYYGFILESPTNLNIEVWLNNLILNWTPPQDVPNPASHYHIYRSTTWNGFDFSIPWVNTSINPDPIDGLIIPLRTTWNDTFAYLDENNNYFYIVRAINNEGWNDTNMNMVGKYVISLEKEWNLISLPLSQRNASMSEVLITIDGKYNIVQWYDAKEEIWRSSTTDLTDINRTMGLWIHMKSSSKLTIIGSVPESTDIALYEGWNLVGYPSLKTRNLNEALSGINWQAVQYYDAFDSVDPWKHNNTIKPENINDLKEMQPGSGYWVRVTINDIWIRTGSADGT